MVNFEDKIFLIRVAMQAESFEDTIEFLDAILVEKGKGGSISSDE